MVMAISLRGEGSLLVSPHFATAVYLACNIWQYFCLVKPSSAVITTVVLNNAESCSLQGISNVRFWFIVMRSQAAMVVTCYNACCGVPTFSPGVPGQQFLLSFFLSCLQLLLLPVIGTCHLVLRQSFSHLHVELVQTRCPPLPFLGFLTCFF